MIDSRVPIIHSFPQSQSITILLSSDMHVGNHLFDEYSWRNFEKLLQQPDVYVIFAGDQMEYATPRSKSSVYEQDLHPREQKRWWIDHMKPYKDKCLCVIDGNHEWNRASREADAYPLYDVCMALNIEQRYRSEAAFVDIGIGRQSHGGCTGKPYRYIFRVVHKAQNLVNYGLADAFDGIDVFVAGHSHRPMDKPLAKLVYDQNKKTVRKKDVENFVCGAWLTYGGYGERGGMRPCATKQYSVQLFGTCRRIDTHGFHVEDL